MPVPETTFARWRYALKLQSWPKVLVPAFLGQCLGVVDEGELEPGALLVGALFTVFIVCFVVLLNDWGDRDVDAMKRRMFPEGCSPKTIPDGILPAYQLLVAGVLCGVAGAVTAVAGELWLGRDGLGLLGVGCLGVFVAYSLPPVRLNYRGGGELLEMLGVGIALPLMHAYLQSGRVLPSTWAVIPGVALLALASATASGLSDEMSDRRGGKRTLTTLLGNRIARRITETSVLAAVAAWCAAAMWSRGVPFGAVIAPALLVHFERGRMKRVSPSATTNEFAALQVYKVHLHRAVWHGTTLLGLLLLVRSVIAP